MKEQLEYKILVAVKFQTCMDNQLETLVTLHSTILNTSWEVGLTLSLDNYSCSKVDHAVTSGRQRVEKQGAVSNYYN